MHDKISTIATTGSTESNDSFSFSKNAFFNVVSSLHYYTTYPQKSQVILLWHTLLICVFKGHVCRIFDVLPCFATFSRTTKCNGFLICLLGKYWPLFDAFCWYCNGANNGNNCRICPPTTRVNTVCKLRETGQINANFAIANNSKTTLWTKFLWRFLLLNVRKIHVYLPHY